MLSRHATRVSQQLSLYLDDRLEGIERLEIERRIANDAAVREEYQQLKAMQAMLASRDALPENPFLAERIMNRLHEHTGERDDASPVSHRFLPVTAGLFAVLLAAVALFAWLQRDDIVHYVEETGAQMQHAYEETILKGWIMPLFQRTDRDQVLHFAMFGTLPLDREDGTILRIDENATQGYRVELAREPELARPHATIDELYSEIEPTEMQRKVFDSLFLYAQRQIESSVLMNDEKELAIDPAISTYQKVILSGIAASLEPDQQERFERFLSQRHTPYTFVSRISRQTRPASTQRPDRVIEHFRTVPLPEEFVVFTRDSISRTRLHLDMDSLRRLMKMVEDRMPRIQVEVKELVRIQIRGNDNVMREMEIDLLNVLNEIAILRREETPRTRSVTRSSRPQRMPRETDVRIDISPDSEMHITVGIDSVINRALQPLERMGIDFPADSMGMRDRFDHDWRRFVPEERLRTLDSLLRRHIPGDSGRWRRHPDPAPPESRFEHPERLPEGLMIPHPMRPRLLDPASTPLKKDTVYDI
ncbi:MAG: hypothetical protein JXA28_07745 [Bacteroidetes bacterium]|nr:hypothetical protein [Bacteroidota bacterium]